MACLGPLGERVERADPAALHATAGCQAEGGSQRHADAGKRARPAARRDAIELREFHAGRAQHLLCGGEDPGIRPGTEGAGPVGELLLTANQRDAGRRRCRIHAEHQRMTNRRRLAGLGFPWWLRDNVPLLLRGSWPPCTEVRWPRRLSLQ